MCRWRSDAAARLPIIPRASPRSRCAFAMPRAFGSFGGGSSRDPGSPCSLSCGKMSASSLLVPKTATCSAGPARCSGHTPLSPSRNVSAPLPRRARGSRCAYCARARSRTPRPRTRRASAPPRPRPRGRCSARARARHTGTQS
eukprot:6418973-Prymnesium_polylepis.2